MNRKTLVKYLDVTLVRTLTTLEDVQHHLADAKQYKYRSVIGRVACRFLETCDLKE